MAKDVNIQVMFKFERETPGTLRFMEVDESGNKKSTNYAIGTLYIRKTALHGATPTELQMNITLPKA